jgi:hypothetical protein
VRAIPIDVNTADGYERFLRVKSLPRYAFQGRTAFVPDEYADLFGVPTSDGGSAEYHPSEFLFDYQRDIAAMAIRKRKFAVFADCGLGKTCVMFEFARHAASALRVGQAVLIISPLMVIQQTIDEAKLFYGDGIPLEYVPANDLPAWLRSGTQTYGITNYEALSDRVEPGRLGALIVDESSMLKSHYGVWGQHILRLGRGLRWKLCGTGTPAPNDRIEYANHAVFLDAFPNVNSFLARFFVNRGQTDNRWELKPHALGPFYRALSDWAIFLANPATYGWKDHSEDIPPIHVHIESVPMTAEQNLAVQERTGSLFVVDAGGIGTRGALSQISKGRHNGKAIATNKPAFIRRMIESWPEESTIIWCHYNAEQETMAATFPEAGNITGDTPYDERMRIIADFKAGRSKILVTKPKILGFGQNLQIATRQVWSGLQDSYEEFYQGVKRSNRVGSTRPLNVHIPVTDAERPMIQTVLAKAKRVQQDGEEQERIFQKYAIAR